MISECVHVLCTGMDPLLSEHVPLQYKSLIWSWTLAIQISRIHVHVREHVLWPHKSILSEHVPGHTNLSYTRIHVREHVLWPHKSILYEHVPGHTNLSYLNLLPTLQISLILDSSHTNLSFTRTFTLTTQIYMSFVWTCSLAMQISLIWSWTLATQIYFIWTCPLVIQISLT